MDRVERNARLLCEAEGEDPDMPVGTPPDDMRPFWHDYVPQVQGLAAAGLTLAPLEPDEETVADMARAIEDAPNATWEQSPTRRRLARRLNQARAAYRAAVQREQG